MQNYKRLENVEDLALFLDEDYISKDDIPDFITCDINMFNEVFDLDTTYYTYLKEIFDVLWFETHNNVQPHVAGGLLRRVFNGEKFDDNYDADIDVFFADTYKESNNNHQRSVVQFLCKTLDTSLDETQQKALNENRNVKVKNFQVMGQYYDVVGSNRDPISCIIHNLRSFDSYVNMAAIHFKSETIIMHRDFMFCNAKKHYKFNTDIKNRSHPVSIFQRYSKFEKMGYTGKPEDFRNMAKLVVNKENDINREDVYNDQVTENVKQTFPISSVSSLF